MFLMTESARENHRAAREARNSPLGPGNFNAPSAMERGAPAAILDSGPPVPTCHVGTANAPAAGTAKCDLTPDLKRRRTMSHPPAFKTPQGEAAFLAAYDAAMKL